MPSYFISRMQFGLHQDPDHVTALLLDLVQQAPIDEVMLFFNGVELNAGYESLDEKRRWLEHSRPYRQALEANGIAVSFNPPDTMHVVAGSRPLRPDQPWQRLVSPTGQEATGQVCPLDSGWQRYILEVYDLYAREAFSMIWVDDDFRLHNHPPLEWGGCFCSLHLAELKRRTGIEATREEVVANCTAPGPPHSWREPWLDMWDETMCDLLDRLRQTVAQHGSRLGLMSSCPQAHAAEGRNWDRWWRALSGPRPPVHRPHFWPYSETEGTSLPNYITLLDQNRRVQPAGVDCKPEIDCYPYGRWNKSFRQIGAQMALAHVLGANGLNLSLYDFMGNDPDDEPQRAEFLRRWRPICDWLSDTFPMSLRSHGIGVPWSPDVGRRHHADGSGRWGSITPRSFGWDHRHFGWPKWLGAAGHAFAMAPDTTINAISAAEVWSFDRDVLEGWLSEGLLLDGPAAAALMELGLGDLIGFQDGQMVDREETPFHIENVLDAAFGLRSGAQISRAPGPRFAGTMLPDATRVSDLRGPRQEVVGHGVVLFGNALGGRVATVPWASTAEVRINACRAAQLSGILRFLDPDGAHGSVSGGAWLVPQFLTDGLSWRGVIWNASADAVDSMVLQPPSAAGMPSEAVSVHADAARLTAEIERSTLKLARPLQQWEFVVLTW